MWRGEIHVGQKRLVAGILNDVDGGIGDQFADVWCEANAKFWQRFVVLVAKDPAAIAGDGLTAIVVIRLRPLATATGIQPFG